MLKLYVSGFCLLAALSSVNAQTNRIFPQKNQDSILQKLTQLAFPSIHKPFKSIPINVEGLKLDENFALDTENKSAMPIYKSDSSFHYPLRIFIPSKTYEYKMRIIDMPVQNSKTEQS